LKWHAIIKSRRCQDSGKTPEILLVAGKRYVSDWFVATHTVIPRLRPKKRAFAREDSAVVVTPGGAALCYAKLTISSAAPFPIRQACHSECSEERSDERSRGISGCRLKRRPPALNATCLPERNKEQSDEWSRGIQIQSAVLQTAVCS